MKGKVNEEKTEEAKPMNFAKEQMKSTDQIKKQDQNELKDKNIKLVSFREGLRQEINRVSNLSNENYLRLNYLKNFCMSFYQFSRFLSYYFKKHKGL